MDITLTSIFTKLMPMVREGVGTTYRWMQVNCQNGSEIYEFYAISGDGNTCSPCGSKTGECN